MSAENERACVRLQLEGFGGGDLSVVDELVAPSFVGHTALPGSPPGRDSVKTTIDWVHRAFSDVNYEIQDVFSSGDRVALRTFLSGTHTGEFMGRPPTGKRFTSEHIHIFRMHDGKIAEHWACRDDIGTLRQLGLI